MFITLIKLSESDKRLIFAFLLIFILVLVLIALIGYLIVRVMKWQGRRLDNGVSDVVYARVITDRTTFIRYARKKNWRMFYKSARISVVIMLVSGLILLIRNMIARDFTYDVFNTESGFGSLLFCWDFSQVIKIGGGTISFQWPTLINSPHFAISAWGSYLFVPGMTIGGLWYLWCVQSLIARSLRIRKLGDSIFSKNLDNFNQNEQLMNSLNNQQNSNNSGQNPNNPQ